MTRDRSVGRGVRAGVRRLLRFPLRTRRAVETEADAELEAYLGERIEHLMARGFTAAEARAEGLARLGGTVDDTRHTLRRSAAQRDRRLRVRDAVDDAVAELRLAGRSLVRSPGFAATTIGTVALAVGAACTLFAVVHPILLRPLPYPNADRLVGLWYAMPGLGLSTVKQSLATYVIDRDYSKTLAAAGVYASLASTLSYERSGAPSERARVTYATPSVFRVLGARPLIGRLFTDADTGRGAPVIISEALWRTRFGADPHVLGQTLDIDGAPRPIIGVMPASFAFPQASTPAWVAQGSAHVQYAGSFGWDGIGRLRPGVTMAQAQRELQALLARLPQRFPEVKPGASTAVALRQSRPIAIVHSMHSDVIAGVDRVLWLITCIARRGVAMYARPESNPPAPSGLV